MPVLARFYGIIIRMYFQQAEHNPPHIHAIYDRFSAIIDIQSTEVLFGQLPVIALAMVKEWITIHKQELMDMWETQIFKKLPPLE